MHFHWIQCAATHARLVKTSAEYVQNDPPSPTTSGATLISPYSSRLVGSSCRSCSRRQCRPTAGLLSAYRWLKSASAARGHLHLLRLPPPPSTPWSHDADDCHSAGARPTAVLAPSAAADPIHIHYYHSARLTQLPTAEPLRIDLHCLSFSPAMALRHEGERCTAAVGPAAGAPRPHSPRPIDGSALNE